MLDQTNADLIGWPSDDRLGPALRHRAQPSTRCAYGDHPRFRRSGFGKMKEMQHRLWIDPEQGKVGGGVRRDNHPISTIAIGKGRVKGLGTANHMGSGYGQSIRAQNPSAAEAVGRCGDQESPRAAFCGGSVFSADPQREA